MPKRKTHKQVLDEVALALPNIKILGAYQGCNNKILVEDEYGVKYMSTIDSLRKGHMPGVDAAFNKTDAFISKIKRIRNDVIIRGEYINHTTKIACEDMDGYEHLITPQSLMRCLSISCLSLVDKDKWFSDQSKKIHGEKYDYNHVTYTNNHSRVKIGCPTHGHFMQEPLVHLMGCGCPLCGNELAYAKIKNNFCGYNKTSWVNSCIRRNIDPSVYVIECHDNNERFIKIGMTSIKINKRFWKKMMPYEFKLLFLYTNSAERIFALEKELHRRFKKNKYIPNKKFNGYTECFSPIILNELKNLDIFKLAV